MHPMVVDYVSPTRSLTSEKVTTPMTERTAPRKVFDTSEMSETIKLELLEPGSITIQCQSLPGQLEETKRKAESAKARAAQLQAEAAAALAESEELEQQAEELEQGQDRLVVKLQTAARRHAAMRELRIARKAAVQWQMITRRRALWRRCRLRFLARVRLDLAKVQQFEAAAKIQQAARRRRLLLAGRRGRWMMRQVAERLVLVRVVAPFWQNLAIQAELAARLAARRAAHAARMDAALVVQSCERRRQAVVLAARKRRALEQKEQKLLAQRDAHRPLEQPRWRHHWPHPTSAPADVGAQTRRIRYSGSPASRGQSAGFSSPGLGQNKRLGIPTEHAHLQNRHNGTPAHAFAVPEPRPRARPSSAGAGLSRPGSVGGSGLDRRPSAALTRRTSATSQICATSLGLTAAIQTNRAAGVPTARAAARRGAALTTDNKPPWRSARGGVAWS